MDVYMLDFKYWILSRLIEIHKNNDFKGNRNLIYNEL